LSNEVSFLFETIQNEFKLFDVCTIKNSDIGCFAPVIEGLLSPLTDFRVHDRTWNLFALVIVEEQEVVVNWKIK